MLLTETICGADEGIGDSGFGDRVARVGNDFQGRFRPGAM